jgi:farnesyl-diphosphate farnesyltransferase
MNDITSVEVWSGKDRADENFPVGSALIRRDLRVHVHAYYRFARNADDIGDSETLAPEDKIARLNVMEYVLLGKSDYGSPSALGLRSTLVATGLDPSVGTDLLHAFRQDAVKHRYETWEELLDYCRYSAAPVGRLLLGLHGENAETFAPSDALCASLQVLNHLQDCKQDLATLDRCYLPLDLMELNGAKIDDLRLHRTLPPLRAVFDYLLDYVDELNNQSRKLPALVRDRRMRLESAIVVNLALRLTEHLRRGDPLAARVKLTKSDFIGATLAALRYLP